MSGCASASPLPRLAVERSKGGSAEPAAVHASPPRDGMMQVLLAIYFFLAGALGAAHAVPAACAVLAACAVPDDGVLSYVL